MYAIDFCSFRDPSGVVIKLHDRILRLVKKDEEKHLREIIINPAVQNFIKNRKVPNTEILSEQEFHKIATHIPEVDPSNFSVCVEHEAIPFPSYSHEWAPEMLHCAANFTLELSLLLLKNGWGLKDATPYNVLFRGANPVFVDFLSFERRDPLDAIWTPYAQFVRTFLLPLIANRENKIPLSQIFMHKMEGLEPEDIYELTKGLDLLKPGIFSLVTMPTWLARGSKSSNQSSQLYQKKKSTSKDLAAFILERIFKGLQKNIRRFSPQPKKTKWTHYFSKEESYSKDEFKVKENIVSKFFEQTQPKTLLDIGCNTGHFSKIAANKGASVIAIDSDPAVIGMLWREAHKSNLDILPLVVDICRPSPALGWNNREQLSFLKRSKGYFDTVLMLAVLHHMSVTARVPFDDIAKMCSEMTTGSLIIEFISPEDPMFRTIVRGRESLYAHLTQDYFESIWKKHFILRAKEQSGAFRWIYLFEKKK